MAAKFTNPIRGGLVAAALLLTAVPAHAAEVEGLRIWSGPESTRLVLDLSQPVEHRVFVLKNPNRVVVDLAGARLSSGAPQAEARGYVKSVRSAPRDGGGLRVVFDLKQRVKPQSFALVPNDTYGHRLVIDLKPPRAAGRVVKRVEKSKSPTGRDLVIAIDPGHGGEDPGATGRRGVREKDVVLGIAQKLARQVDAEPGMKAALIRSGDYFLPLRSRMEKAHQANADFFVSIHADAFRTADARGATVYVLSEKGAGDEASRRLAERENASDLVGGVSLKDKDQLLARVLLDLSQNAALNASMMAGEEVIKSLRGVARVRKTRVQQAPFLVLKSPDIPSILIETGYISNPQQESELASASHQAALAKAIHSGIKRYFYSNPPPGTYVARSAAQTVKPMRHVIARGDTLSEIAERYGVAVTQIRSANRLRNDRIVIGQVLTIPRI
jgi:N-acetylmuramoyl-L-alanine amidase